MRAAAAPSSKKIIKEVPLVPIPIPILYPPSASEDEEDEEDEGAKADVLPAVAVKTTAPRVGQGKKPLVIAQKRALNDSEVENASAKKRQSAKKAIPDEAARTEAYRTPKDVRTDRMPPPLPYIDDDNIEPFVGLDLDVVSPTSLQPYMALYEENGIAEKTYNKYNVDYQEIQNFFDKASTHTVNINLFTFVAVIARDALVDLSEYVSYKKLQSMYYNL